MLVMVISTFGVIYNNVLSTPPPSNPPNVTIIGTVEGNNLVLEHQKGDSLSLDTKITVNTGIQNETFLVKKYLDAESIKDGEWNIVEVKSSTEVKDVNIQDVAFQKYVYERAGLKIRKCFLMCVNSEYVKNGKIDCKKLMQMKEKQFLHSMI